MKLIAVKGHKSNYPNPILLKKGECVTPGKKDIEFEGWIWVTTNGGNQGWAPIQYLQLGERSDKAIAKQDYTAKELETCVGDELTLHYELNDWGWVEKNDGSCGWIPMNTTQFAE